MQDTYEKSKIVLKMKNRGFQESKIIQLVTYLLLIK
jgi:hypothetical protein